MNQTQVGGSVEPGTPGAPVSRRRTYDWQDPAPGLRRLSVTSGADLLRAMERGELPVPPLAATLDFERFVVVDEGTVELTLVPGEHHLNPIGTVHGGVIAAMLDTVAGCAVHSVLPAGTGYTSLDLHTRFLRAVTPATGRVRAVGTVVTRGSRTATAEARLVDERDRLLATATSTCLVFDLA